MKVETYKGSNGSTIIMHYFVYVLLDIVPTTYIIQLTRGLHVYKLNTNYSYVSSKIIICQCKLPEIINSN